MVLKHWIVTTPQYTNWTYDPYEPPEYTVDYVVIEASSKKEARAKSIKEMRKQYPRGYIAGDSLSNPFKGLKVEEAICEHGVCYCDICAYDKTKEECKECLLKWEQEDTESWQNGIAAVLKTDDG